MTHCSAPSNSFIGARPTSSSSRSRLRGVTTIAELEERFPLVPVTIYVPGCSARNLPSASIVAPLPLTDQRVEKSPAGLPCAVNLMTSPVRADFAAPVIVMLRRLLLMTATLVVALAAPDVAVIVALPGPTPVTTPPASTVATCGLSEVQLIGTPVRGSPL